jgi:hypothetical protein
MSRVAEGNDRGPPWRAGHLGRTKECSGLVSNDMARRLERGFIGYAGGAGARRGRRMSLSPLRRLPLRRMAGTAVAF